jgi:hypothetical protein
VASALVRRSRSADPNQSLATHPYSAMNPDLAQLAWLPRWYGSPIPRAPTTDQPTAPAQILRTPGSR